jgi:hypothetical protein
MTTGDRLIITPAEAGAMGVDFIQRVHDKRDRLMPILLPGEISMYFAPLLPGEMTLVIAQTHNGKSTFMKLWARRMSQHLKANGRGDEAIVWVDTEHPAEYVATGFVSGHARLSYNDVMTTGGLDPKRLIAASNVVADTPLYIIATRLGDDDNDSNEIHLTNIKRSLKMLKDGKIDGAPRKIAAIFIDFLQALPIDPAVRRTALENQRRTQVSRDLVTIRRMSATLDCPVIVGVQAKQLMAPSPHKDILGLPGIFDGEETSANGQRPDRILSLSVTAQNFPLGEEIKYRNARFMNRRGLLFVRVVKQRAVVGDLPAGHVFAFEFQKDTTDPMTAIAHVWSEWTP